MVSEMMSRIVNAMSQIDNITLPDRIQYCSKLIVGNNFLWQNQNIFILSVVYWIITNGLSF